MKVTNLMTITKRSNDGAFYGELNCKPYTITSSDSNYAEYSEFYDLMRSTPYDSRPAKYEELERLNKFPNVLGKLVAEAVKPTPTRSKEEILVDGIKKLMDFFTEFSFVPSFRFTNTFAFMCAESLARAQTYVCNYFALMDSSYQKEVAQKVKSSEFKAIVNAVKQYGTPTTVINSRFKIYYGSAGTGKTTLAQTESDNRCIVCNSSMLPSDLMEDFIFKDGNPDFNPSLLWDCMEQGKTIVLDEINLLPFDSLRFLQGIVDGKSEFYYKNRPVHINDGFQIIGTMNLSLGGMTYGLPEPLVDRCSDAREFILSAEQLATAIIGRTEDGE